VWRRTVNGRDLHFHLAGINNQNFLMRDEETNSWWQQISGKAIYGPLKGAALDPVLSDELTFGEWKSEVSGGQVLAPVAKYAKEYESDWEPKVGKLPVVISFPGTELKSRDVVVGLVIDGSARAYPWETALKQSPIVDRVNGTPLLLAVGPDKKSFRVFVSRVNGKDAEFFLKGDIKDWVLLDTTTASEWNFQGCATSGPSLGKCLDHVYALKDYWFDWRNYHPETTIYRH
jgi:Protein of unknown function (DUF3179)